MINNQYLQFQSDCCFVPFGYRTMLMNRSNICHVLEESFRESRNTEILILQILQPKEIHATGFSLKKEQSILLPISLLVNDLSSLGLSGDDMVPSRLTVEQSRTVDGMPELQGCVRAHADGNGNWKLKSWLQGRKSLNWVYVSLVNGLSRLSEVLFVFQKQFESETRGIRSFLRLLTLRIQELCPRQRSPFVCLWPVGPG